MTSVMMRAHKPSEIWQSLILQCSASAWQEHQPCDGKQGRTVDFGVKNWLRPLWTGPQGCRSGSTNNLGELLAHSQDFQLWRAASEGQDFACLCKTKEIADVISLLCNFLRMASSVVYKTLLGQRGL